MIDDNTALVIVQYPDFFGRIYDFTSLIEAAHAQGALVCVAANPIALGLLKTPGEMGADIVAGEGQPLGIPLSFGGPYLGFFATRKQYIHKMAGRLVGETVDNRGQRAYVLDTHRPRTTHQARTRHIQHMYQPGPDGLGCGSLPVAAWAQRPAPGGRTLLPQSALCR